MLSRISESVKVQTGSPRTAWIDVARGACIVLVVFMHFDAMHFATAGAPTTATRIWDFATSAMRPARMPAFFMISGMLAGRMVHEKANRKFALRIANLAYLYALWATIYLFVFYNINTPMNHEYVSELLRIIPKQAIWPSNQIWYIYALIVF